MLLSVQKAGLDMLTPLCRLEAAFKFSWALDEV